jgi:hypothetical protein
MIYERDIGVTISDGLMSRVNVYRPRSDGRFSVVTLHGPRPAGIVTLVSPVASRTMTAVIAQALLPSGTMGRYVRLFFPWIKPGLRTLPETLERHIEHGYQEYPD